MKFAALVVVAFAMSIQPLGATPTELTFAATVTSSTGATGLPVAGTAIQGQISFDYDPAAYMSQPCPGLDPSKCIIYSFSTPYTFFVDLGASQLSSPVWELSVVDDTTLFDPNGPPMDAITLGAKVNGISYVLTLIGPASSFTGVDIRRRQCWRTLGRSACSR